MKTLNYEFTIDEMNIILAGLSELQARPPVVDLINRIRQEAEIALQNTK